MFLKPSQFSSMPPTVDGSGATAQKLEKRDQPRTDGVLPVTGCTSDGDPQPRLSSLAGGRLQGDRELGLGPCEEQACVVLGDGG